MATTPELARYYTTLDTGAIDHLQRLVASWGLLADICFADLLLWARVDPGRKVPGVAEEAEGAAERLVVLGRDGLQLMGQQRRHRPAVQRVE